MDIARCRVHNQFITRPFRQRPADLVAWLGAVQAQEYPFAKWAIGLRSVTRMTDGDVEEAFTRGEILRTHVMRPTWHFVAAEDIGWMLELTAPRVLAAMAFYARYHSLDTRLLVRTTAVVERSLSGRRHLTRPELGDALARAGMTVTSNQLTFIAMYAELERVICSGPRRGKQFTYALVSERAPDLRRLSGDEALAELARRFLRSHGPATLRDFVWWSGLRVRDARRGFDIVGAGSREQDGLQYWLVGDPPRVSRMASSAYLLPIYDEYLVAYRDRSAVPHGPAKVKAPGGPVAFRNPVVIDGQVAGTWRTDPSGRAVHVYPTRPLKRGEKRELERAVARYERFVGIRT